MQLLELSECLGPAHFKLRNQSTGPTGPYGGGAFSKLEKAWIPFASELGFESHRNKFYICLDSDSDQTEFQPTISSALAHEIFAKQ